jgi:3-oxoacyl-[acyl-carrier protein] reductase
MMTITTDLSGKTALVTGASSGIGAGVARALAANGAKVVLNYPDETQERPVAEVLGSIEAAGGEGVALLADVSSEEQVLAMFEQIQAQGWGLHILVNSSPVELMEVADFDRLMGIHVRGTFLCTRSALPIFYEQNWGRVINTASQLAYIGAPGFSHYTAAKGAILSFTRSLALEIGDRSITANCVAPGATMTPILEGVPDEVLEAIRGNIPAGRLAEVEDIVGSYVFLASEAAAHYRGQCLSPNGGDAFL